MTIDDSENLIINELSNRYEAKEVVIIHVGIVLDATACVYLNGEKLVDGEYIRSDSGENYTEYIFIMPDCDSIITTNIVGGL